MIILLTLGLLVTSIVSIISLTIALGALGMLKRQQAEMEQTRLTMLLGTRAAKIATLKIDEFNNQLSKFDISATVAEAVRNAVNRHMN